MPRHAPLSPFQARLLEQEYAILQGVSLSGVLRVHALLNSDHGWCLVLEDRGGVPLPALFAARRLDLETFFALALQVTTILAEVHRHEIMHKHLTPWSILVQWGRALQGLTEHPLSFTDATFDEAAYCRTYQGQRLFEMFHIVARLAVLYTFGDYQAAREAAQHAAAIIRNDFSGTIWDALRIFYQALTLEALAAAATPAERQETIRQLEVLN
jgi:hypothetical protein